MKEFDKPTQTNDSEIWRNQDSNRRESPNFDKVKTTISDKLHSAAETLREKSQAVYGKNKDIAGYGNQTADWLNRSANYIEDINPQKLKGDLENQVRYHPGRSLLIAAGVGLVLGSLFRRR
jgi:ElaB/YqjD/DUF883 family membrane-anchored ribosome-binding protein